MAPGASGIGTGPQCSRTLHHLSAIFSGLYFYLENELSPHGRKERPQQLQFPIFYLPVPSTPNGKKPRERPCLSQPGQGNGNLWPFPEGWLSDQGKG